MTSLYDKLLQEMQTLQNTPQTSTAYALERQHSKGRLSVWERLSYLTGGQYDLYWRNFGDHEDGASIVTAIGDIHGCLNQLISIHDQIFNYKNYKKEEDLLIYIGDYIDRGPKSKQVIDQMLQLKNKKHIIIMNLCGRGDKDVFTVAEAIETFLPLTLICP